MISDRSRKCAGRVGDLLIELVLGRREPSFSKVSDTSAMPNGACLSLPLKIDRFHGVAAQMLGALLAEHPADGVDDVRFAAAVRPDDAGYPGGNSSTVRVGKDLKPTSSSCLIRIPTPPDKVGQLRPHHHMGRTLSRSAVRCQHSRKSSTACRRRVRLSDLSDTSDLSDLSDTRCSAAADRDAAAPGPVRARARCSSRRRRRSTGRAATRDSGAD